MSMLLGTGGPLIGLRTYSALQAAGHEPASVDPRQAVDAILEHLLSAHADASKSDNNRPSATAPACTICCLPCRSTRVGA